MPDLAARVRHGYVYYLDGAGGGGLVANWGRGVRKGLDDAGYQGACEVFRWGTGLGVVADQHSSVKYKKSRASELAKRIQQYSGKNRQAPVTLIGLSAGTAVAVFTLEMLPVNCPVENVILLGASIHTEYDLTPALRRVHNRMYVFTSEQDAVLAFLVPVTGTADRERGVDSAGLRGFRMPAGATLETRSQYAKLVHIRWKPEFAQAGDFGGHTDTVKPRFVQDYIAPLVMQGAVRRPQPETALASPTVANPDYDRWVDFEAGSWVALEGNQVLNGVKQPLRLVAKLVAKQDDRLVFERTYVLFEAGRKEPSQVQQFVVPAQIKPEEDPLTHPRTKITRLPGEHLMIMGKPLHCNVMTLEARGDVGQWGRDLTYTLYLNDSIPGGLVKVFLKSRRGNQQVEFEGQLAGYETAK